MIPSLLSWMPQRTPRISTSGKSKLNLIYYKFYEIVLFSFRVTRDQVRKYIKPFVFHKDSMKKFYASLCFLTVGKAIGISSPFILKYVVNMMASVQTATAGAAVAVAGSAFSLNRAIGAVGLWGLTRLVTNTFMCFHMN